MGLQKSNDGLKMVTHIFYNICEGHSGRIQQLIARRDVEELLRGPEDVASKKSVGCSGGIFTRALSDAETLDYIARSTMGDAISQLLFVLFVDGKF
jgi:hypothetical protein